MDTMTKSKSNTFRKAIYSIIVTLTLVTCGAKAKNKLNLSTDFPSVEYANELVILSSAVYDRTSCNDPVFPDGIDCQWYERYNSNEVLIATSDVFRYIAVSLAGSDDLPDWISDAEMALAPFGPEEDPINPNVKVHHGFNKDVFRYGFYDMILLELERVIDKFPEYQVVVTGHSLGAAEATLIATALSLDLELDRPIQSINYASPRTGDEAWKDWVNGIPNLGIWRFVYNNDIVPRLPVTRYWHVGHTIELRHHSALCYYLHDGDDELGYAGVPEGWQNGIRIRDHDLTNYLSYIANYSIPDPDQYYVDSFVLKRNDTLNALALPAM